MVQVVVFLGTVIFDTLSIYLDNFLVLIDQEKFPSFSSINLLISLIYSFSINFHLHLDFSMRDLILVGVFGDDILDLFL